MNRLTSFPSIGSSLGIFIMFLTPLIHVSGCSSAPLAEQLGSEAQSLNMNVNWDTDWKCQVISPAIKNVYTVAPGDENLIFAYAIQSKTAIRVKPGNYHFSHPIIVASHTLIAANDPSAPPKFIVDGPSFPVKSTLLLVQNAEQVVIQNIHVEGTDIGAGGTPAKTGIGIENSNHVLLDHTDVRYVFGSAYRVSKSSCIHQYGGTAIEIQYGAGGCNPAGGEADGMNIANSNRVLVDGTQVNHVERAGFIALDSSDLSFMRDSVGDIGASCINKGVGLAARMAQSVTSAPVNLLVTSFLPVSGGADITGAGIFVTATSGTLSQIVGISSSNIHLISGSTWNGIYLCGGLTASSSDIASTSVLNGDMLASMTLASAATDSCSPASCTFANPCSTSSIWW